MLRLSCLSSLLSHQAELVVELSGAIPEEGKETAAATERRVHWFPEYLRLGGIATFVYPARHNRERYRCGRRCDSIESSSRFTVAGS